MGAAIIKIKFLSLLENGAVIGASDGMINN